MDIRSVLDDHAATVTFLRAAALQCGCIDLQPYGVQDQLPLGCDAFCVVSSWLGGLTVGSRMRAQLAACILS